MGYKVYHGARMAIKNAFVGNAILFAKKNGIGDKLWFEIFCTKLKWAFKKTQVLCLFIFWFKQKIFKKHF
jgi:hypothetical protein